MIGRIMEEIFDVRIYIDYSKMNCGVRYVIFLDKLINDSSFYLPDKCNALQAEICNINQRCQ